MAKQSAKSKDAGSMVADNLKREQFVELLGMTASSLEVQATVLPTKQLDPRFSMGREVVRLNNNTPFSGEYQLTEVVTTYQGGVRSRDISGVGLVIDGLTAVEDPRNSLDKSSADNVTDQEVAQEPASTNTNTGTGGGKPTVPDSQMIFDVVNNVWKKVSG